MLKYSTGLRDKMLAYRARPIGAIIGATLAFVDNGASPDSITDSGNGFITADFAPGQILFVQGATTSANDTGCSGKEILSVAAGTITIATGSVDTAEAGAAGTVVAVAKGGCLADVMKDGVIKIYSGSQPADADTTIGSATLLLTLTQSSGAWVADAFDNGLDFEQDASSAVLTKESTETWSGVAVASGEAGFFRHYANATDDGSASTTLPRIDGSVGSSGDLKLYNSIVSGRTYTLTTYQLTFPSYYGASS